MARFDNLDEIIGPSIMADRRFLALLKKAVATGRAVTRAQVTKAFGFAPWEECIMLKNRANSQSQDGETVYIVARRSLLPDGNFDCQVLKVLQPARWQVRRKPARARRGQRSEASCSAIAA